MWTCKLRGLVNSSRMSKQMRRGERMQEEEDGVQSVTEPEGGEPSGAGHLQGPDGETAACFVLTHTCCFGA